MKPDAFIFSKNRPAQLDLLARSIGRFAPDTFRDTYLISATLTFEESLRGWLYGSRLSDTICFLVDDDVFIREPGPIHAVPCSFRLGDYDYPLSLDGCVYKTDEIRTLLHEFSFDNPTQLEAGMDARRDEWPHRSGPEMSAFRHVSPCLVGVPHNRVSASSNMPTMGGTADELNARYAAGERISLDAIVRDVDLAGGAHQNIVYEWESR
jgi:hypothetical protein